MNTLKDRFAGCWAPRKRWFGKAWTIGVVCLCGCAAPRPETDAIPQKPRPVDTTASSCAEGFRSDGPLDGNRFDAGSQTAWAGQPGQADWWWQVRFARPQELGAIFQVVGDHEFCLRNSPKAYAWQCSRDGKTWQDIEETRTKDERRMFRVHRLKKTYLATHVRLRIDEAHGKAPTLREVEFYRDRNATIETPPWAVIVSTIEKPTGLDQPSDYLKLLRLCPNGKTLPVQQVWLDSFNEAFVAAEPRPLCAFLTGNFKDWCEVAREPWRGTQEVLNRRNLPIYAACGGAQGLALLSTAGVDKPWDCPHCRDPKAPKSPVYGHIGHTTTRPCGDYSGCIPERGIFNIRALADDPLFAGLPREFKLRESHVGQVEFVPPGWTLIATRGRGAKTRMQGMRLNDRYIYAVQFHIELCDGTLEASVRIMENFLSLARQWGGYNPGGAPIAAPHPMPVTTTRSDPASAAAVIGLVGDSTVCDYPAERNIRGWGQVFGAFFDDDVRIANHAKSGRSSKSFIREGLWDKTLAARPDYVFIQFGHNDCPGKGERSTDPNSDYGDYLRKYIDDSRKIGATPILVTPMARRTFTKDGRMADTLRPYAEAMIRVAAERKVPVIDLHKRSIALFEKLGDAGSASLSCSPGDRTHFSEKGARTLAEIVAEEAFKAVPDLRPYMKRRN